jgi:ketosteroid isomerase-like protein
VDDIALFIVDWTMKGTTPDGQDFQYEGAAADMARRGQNGHWRLRHNLLTPAPGRPTQ